MYIHICLLVMYRVIASKLTKSICNQLRWEKYDNKTIVWITKRIYFKEFVYKLLLLFKTCLSTKCAAKHATAETGEFLNKI